jgi:Family of unknown function (DUF6204)
MPNASNDTPTKRTFRVTVRGRFDNLSQQSRSYLAGAVDQHDIFLSSFTKEGTFTYDSKLDFFNFRYELKEAEPDAEQRAVRYATQETEAFLTTMKIGFRDLRAKAMDMSAMWTNHSGT